MRFLPVAGLLLALTVLAHDVVMAGGPHTHAASTHGGHVDPSRMHAHADTSGVHGTQPSGVILGAMDACSRMRGVFAAPVLFRIDYERLIRPAFGDRPNDEPAVRLAGAFEGACAPSASARRALLQVYRI